MPASHTKSQRQRFATEAQRGVIWTRDCPSNWMPHITQAEAIALQMLEEKPKRKVQAPVTVRKFSWE